MTDDLYALMSRGAPKPPEPLNVLDPDADKCCRKSLARHFNRDERIGGESWPESVTCQDCGTRFVRTKVGPTQFWRIAPEFAIVRRR